MIPSLDTLHDADAFRAASSSDDDSCSDSGDFDAIGAFPGLDTLFLVDEYDEEVEFLISA
jgi:hypothetical protein